MTPTLQLERPVQRITPPKLLVAWSSRWDEFKSALEPALGRSEPRLAGEAPFGLIPYRIAISTYLLEAFLIFAVIAIQVKVDQMRPYVAPRISSHDVIYYSGDELPRTEDLGGAESGKRGEAGGQEAHHRTQTIKIARGVSLVPRVVDAPNVKLPSSTGAVANLLAVKPNPGPPPAEGMRSSRQAPDMHASLVAPAPSVIRDYTRSGVALDQVIAPAPSLSRTQPVTAPNLSASVIQPAPSVTNDHVLVAPLLVPAVVAPGSKSLHDRSRIAPTLNANVVAPAPDVSRDKLRSAPSVSPNVIAPAPGMQSSQISRSPVQSAAAVIPPPVSAPERASIGNPKMTLPAPSVVAPPPSNDVQQDMRRLASGTVHDPFTAVVPPPSAQAGSGSLMSRIIGRVLGPSEVVPPPSGANSVHGGGSSAPALTPNVIAPPPSMASSGGGNPNGSRNGSAAALGPNVVAPPSSSGVSGGTGTRAGGSAPMLGPANVPAPPPSLSGSGGSNGTTGGGRGAPSGTLTADNIIPPPPSMGGGTNSSGSGFGRRGSGMGGAMGVGTDVAPPSAGGSGNNAGAVISSDPGSKVGLPTSGGHGALAMSPSGTDKAGLGGAGGGNGIGHGTGSGSGMTGEGSGAGKTGTGRGSDVNAQNGISPAAGPGGAGNAASGNPPVRGVSVSGGSSVVTLPSFGSDPAANDPVPSSPRRSSLKRQQTFDVDVVATANSGGAFEPYRNLLHGEKHTIYPPTTAGIVVMEYADESSATHSYKQPLSSPQAIRVDLPAGLPHARMVLTCTLDASGNLRNVRVLEPGPADMTAKIVAALRAWKFQPAQRGDQPVAVTAILGFGIDTNDRF